MRPLVQDEQMRPNYVPHPAHKDYIDDHDTEQYLLRQQEQKKETDTMEAFYNELQIPVFVMILFFFFQMPFVSKNMRKYLPSLYNPGCKSEFLGIYFSNSSIWNTLLWSSKIYKIFESN